jgi:phosphatidylinositol alpha-mannosyltransferase
VRILLVSPYDLTHPGGVTSHVFDLAQQFLSMGHEPVVTGPGGTGKLPQNEYTHHLGATFRILSPGDAALINVSPFVIPSIREFLKGRTFDVIHLHEPYLPFIGPAFMRYAEGVKVGTFHTWRKGPHLPYLLFRPLVQYLNRQLDGRVAVSPLALETISRYVHAHYEIIPNGVDFNRFARPTPVPAHLDDERPTLLFVGRVEARKGLPYLFDAFKTLKTRRRDARLVIVGDGGLRPTYEKMVQAMGLEDVLFEGYVDPDDLPGYYQRADVFCSPSTVNESFGITLLEAMAAGAPTIATTINATTLGDHGVHGLHVAPKDADAMASAIEEMLEDPLRAERMASMARERACTFDWEKVADRLVAYYRQLGA